MLYSISFGAILKNKLGSQDVETALILLGFYTNLIAVLVYIKNL